MLLGKIVTKDDEVNKTALDEVESIIEASTWNRQKARLAERSRRNLLNYRDQQINKEVKERENSDAS
jgi:hypothetical protein